MSFIRVLMLFSTLAVLTGGAGAVQAQESDKISRPLAPWMALDSSLTEKVPNMHKSGMDIKPIRMNAEHADTKTPKHPILTPHDTRAVIARLYDGTEEEQSALEALYAKRIVDDVKQFGYDMFGTAKANTNNNAENTALPAGAVQDDFVLGIGDRLNITFRGQRQDSKIYTVNAQGMLIIDDMMPMPATGRTIGQLRDALQEEVSKSYNTDVFIALESVKQVNVLVVGHVKEPGRQTLTVFNTVLDALNEAGGINKSGSLRGIKLVRAGRSTIIDLYGLLIHGSAIMDISLRDGDRIIVPPVGPTIAVAGNAKQPGIYEILPELQGHRKTPDPSQALSLDDVLSLSGGVLSPGQNRFMKLSLTPDGKETVQEISESMAPVFTDGSILMISPSQQEKTGNVELAGNTRRPGMHEIDRASSLSKLLPDEKSFGPDIYPLIGIIERRDESQLTPQLIAFPPLLVIKGKFDQRLQEGDVVRLFSRTDIVALHDTKDRKEGTPVARKDRDEEESGYGSLAEGKDDELRHNPTMTSFLKERSVFIRGAVRQEGSFPVAEGISLDNILAIAGGLTLEANSGNIEVTSRMQGEGPQTQGRSGIQRISVNLRDTDPATIMIAAGDSIRVNQKFKRVAENSVLLIGEVKHPGRYDLMPGDKMSDLLTRAGGLTEQAYPDGAIFSRESERRAEEMRFRAQAQDLELKLAAALEHDKEQPDQNKITAVQDLITQLRQAEALGRITVESDPGILSAEPELDILLESGDRVYVPQRPLTVRVAGEVMAGASLQFRKDKEARDYITQAGGYSYNADKDRVFVLYPDGSAQPLQVSMWNHTPSFIPPGSTIVVPRDPKPFDFVQTAKDVSQIISNLAITGIFIEDVRNGDDN